jgi:hypothetical protein
MMCEYYKSALWGVALFICIGIGIGICIAIFGSGWWGVTLFYAIAVAIAGAIGRECVMIDFLLTISSSNIEGAYFLLLHWP